MQSRNWSVVCGHGPPALSVGQGGFHWRLHFELGALVGPGAGWRVLQVRILKDCGVLVTETVPFLDGRCLVLKDNGKVTICVPRLAVSPIHTSGHTDIWSLPFLSIFFL